MDVYAQNAVIEVFFTTNAATGAAVAPLSAYEAGDVLVYKNHSATQRSSVSGITMTSPFDGVVGLHQLSIDTSDNTDAGFWATDSIYTLVLSADTETVDGVVVVAVIGQFKIGQIDANLVSILGTILTETAGLIAAGFKKFFNVATPVSTLNSVRGSYALTKNVALANFPFVMTDAITGQPAPGLTVTAERSLDGDTTFDAMANSVVETQHGGYKINLAAADTNANTALYRFSAAGANDRLIAIVFQA